ncbi:MAG: HEPN domain-containing protein [Firmicutes bacterium]|nr:HEPN domain-containing protein [Bacillota bacterium]
MDNIAVAKEWFTLADLDLQSAVYLQRMKPKPLEIIAYHCQQSAEKYLKGFIAFSGARIRKTHDLVVLNRDCQRYNSSFIEIMDECINLTDYGVNVRYPFHVDLEERDVAEAIEDAEIIKEFIESLTKIKTN